MDDLELHICEYISFAGQASLEPQYKDGIMYKGQRQKWFLLRFDGLVPGPGIAEVQEFRQFDWVDPDWLIQNTASFLEQVYHQVVGEFRAYFPR